MKASKGRTHILSILTDTFSISRYSSSIRGEL